MQQAAEQHVLETIEWPPSGELNVKAANIDDRIYATDCPTPLSTSSSSSNGSASNITVLVECIEDNWKIYVPVRLTISLPLVTVAVPISRGQQITQQDVLITMVDLHRFRRQGFSDINRIVGAKVKKNMRIGDVVEQDDICVVCRNENVMIQAVKQGMIITTKGTALSDGIFGEQIKVKNDKSNRIIDAQVTGIGEVTVQF
ncbi:flagella basal body P-ring formation protein FlgA [Vibrio sp. V03_P4A6T147]|nr:flagella basal body P-ring formation protein FlgA [Vibrio sp. V03_P4A6T147]